tara:strand:- start:8908 stop:9957 length:1050 start_codon:yes stop_codon:yes gene_type:complete
MKNKKKTILITGAAGFIGASLSSKFLENGYKVIGLDNLNSYYDVNLKLNRINNIEKNSNSIGNWSFEKISITEKEKLQNVFDNYKPRIVINLAAQAGVRYSLENPNSYLESNLSGFLNILECSRNYQIEHLIFASSSSVYGGNKLIPFNEKHSVDHPLSLYAATKKSNEVLAHSYSHLFQIPMTGLRFFTVYGPFGRPDMAPMIFANSILRKKAINIFNNGKMSRDFTYIDDVVDAIYKCSFKKPISNNKFYESSPDPSTSFAPYMIFNLGSGTQINLLDFIEKLENEFDCKAIKKMREMQPGDVKSTYADISKLRSWIDYNPRLSIDQGIHNFANWYKKYFNTNYSSS